MKRKFIKKNLFLKSFFLVALTFLGIIAGNKVFADSPDVSANKADITYTHADLNTLSLEEQGRIIYNKPNELAEYDKMNYILVYKKVNAQTVTKNNTATPIATNVATTDTKSSLPKTGTKDNTLFILIGIIVLIGAILLGVHQKKLLKMMIITLFSLVTLSSLTAQATTVSLRDIVTETVEKNSRTNHVPEVIDGYEYVGYILTTENNPISEGQVRVKYVTEDYEPLADDVVLTGVVGGAYTTYDVITDNTYQLKEIQGNSTGVFTNEAQTITYVYEKKKGTVKIIVDDSQIINSEGKLEFWYNDFPDLPLGGMDYLVYVNPIKYVLSDDGVTGVSSQEFVGNVGEAFSLPNNYTVGSPIGVYFDKGDGEEYRVLPITISSVSANPTVYTEGVQTVVVTLAWTLAYPPFPPVY